MSTTGAVPLAEGLKVCCATFYENDLVGALLGAHYHPGGADLSRRLATMCGIQAGDTVVDVACGIGSTPITLARDYGVRVVGVDVSERNVERAVQHAASAGVDQQTEFIVGDAERLPLPDQSAGIVICECSFCLFPDKAAAVGEFARILRSGGRIGIGDVVVDRNRLAPELRSVAGWVACLADASSPEDCASELAGAGLELTGREAHSNELVRMIREIDSKLIVLDSLAPPSLGEIDFRHVRRMVQLAENAVLQGGAGYELMVAVRS